MGSGSDENKRKKTKEKAFINATDAVAKLFKDDGPSALKHIFKDVSFDKNELEKMQRVMEDASVVPTYVDQEAEGFVIYRNANPIYIEMLAEKLPETYLYQMGLRKHEDYINEDNTRVQIFKASDSDGDKQETSTPVNPEYAPVVG